MRVPRSPTEVCKANLSFEIEGSSSNAEAPPGSRPLEGRRLIEAESAKTKTQRRVARPTGQRIAEPGLHGQALPTGIGTIAHRGLHSQSQRDSGKGFLHLEAFPGSRPTLGRMRNEGESVRPKPSHRYGSGSSGLSQPFGDRQYRPRVV